MLKELLLMVPRLPPQDEIDRKYGDRRIITVNGEPVELKVKTGRVFVELFEEEGIDEIRDICCNHIKHGFDINTNKAQYIRRQKTVSDGLKYGMNAEIPEELIGITDQRSKFSENVSILKKILWNNFEFL